MDFYEKLKSMRIILVDDDRFIRTSLSYSFRKKTTEFLAFETAEEALVKARLQPYDAFISDQMLPGMTGLSFLKEIAELHPQSLRILITAHADIQIAVEAIRIGVHDLILKPFGGATVEKSLEGLIQKHDNRSIGNGPGHSRSATCSFDDMDRFDSLFYRISHQIDDSLHNLRSDAELGILEAGTEHPGRQRLLTIRDGIEKAATLTHQLCSLGESLHEEARANRREDAD